MLEWIKYREDTQASRQPEKRKPGEKEGGKEGSEGVSHHFFRGECDINVHRCPDGDGR